MQESGLISAGAVYYEGINDSVSGEENFTNNEPSIKY
jgi:hypothetical protein